jgi:hypothetical protein
MVWAGIVVDSIVGWRGDASCNPGFFMNANAGRLFCLDQDGGCEVSLMWFAPAPRSQGERDRCPDA